MLEKEVRAHYKTQGSLCGLRRFVYPPGPPIPLLVPPRFLEEQLTGDGALPTGQSLPPRHLAPILITATVTSVSPKATDHELPGTPGGHLLYWGNC